jgi:HEAT repeat protein
MNLEAARAGLSSTNIDILIASLKIIGQNGKLTDLPNILSFIKHDNIKIKTTAISSASNLIRENLTIHFNELEPEVRKKLGLIMETLAPPIIDDITKDLYCNDETKRIRAIQILGLLKKNPKVREILVSLIQDKNEKIRATAVNLLGKVVSLEDQELVMSLLNDKDKRVRANTVEALEALGNKKLIPILLRFRNDPVNRIRGNVLKALYNLGYKDIENDLLAMLNSSDNFMKASGLWVISKIKYYSLQIEDKAGFLLLSDNEMVYNNAKNALKSIDTPRAKGYLRYLDKEALMFIDK